MPRRGPSLAILRVVDDKGTTVGDLLIQTIRTLGIGAEAAARAGISRQTFHKTIRDGRRATMKQANGGRLDRRERTLAKFADAITRAEDEWHLRELSRLAEAERGGVLGDDGTLVGPAIVTITEKIDAATGEVIERTRKVQGVPGDISVTKWRLERKYPWLYNPRISVDVNVETPEEGAFGSDRPAPGVELLSTLEAMVERRKQAQAALPPIETTATDGG